MSAQPAAGAGAARAPRLGFLGVGWIGRQRMAAVAGAGVARAVAVADPDPAARAAATEAAPGAVAVDDLGGLLAAGVDGVVIATPSALHAEQAIAALAQGVAVFCQKPLARTAEEAAAVVDAAQRSDVLLGVDLSYRFVRAAVAARDLVAAGELGEVYALDLVFHNAYGPDKPWFASRRLAGGGCLIDLGTHLVDLALWLTGDETAAVQAARVLRAGRPLADAGPDEVEDYAAAQLLSERGAVLRLACSWYTSVGADCAIECTVHGTEGSVSIRNVGGSFYDFSAWRWRGTSAEPLVQPPDDWGPRALAAWAQALGRGDRFDPAVQRVVAVADIIDRIYEAAA